MAETTKRNVINYGKLGRGIAYTFFAIVIGSVVMWVWVGEVREECTSTYLQGWGRVEHWHCSIGTVEQAKLWNVAYDVMWKLGITMAIVSILALIIWLSKDDRDRGC